VLVAGANIFIGINGVTNTISSRTNWSYSEITNAPQNLVTNGQVGIHLVGAILHGGSTNNTGVIITNLLAEGYPATGVYTNAAILFWPYNSDTNARAGLVIQGHLGNYEQIYWPDHGDGGPEMVTTINGRMAFYYNAWQWGNPSGGNGAEFWWNVSGRSPYSKDGVTDYTLTESQNTIFYEAAVWTNSIPIPAMDDYMGGTTTNQALAGPPVYGSGWTMAGSLGDGFPATHFRATSTNGSGAWVWYDKMAMPNSSAYWLNKAILYTNSVERFRITVGPDGGATLVGTMKATAFSAGTNVGISTTWTNLVPGLATNRITVIGGIMVSNQAISW
jgi:hypothetical protein